MEFSENLAAEHNFFHLNARALTLIRVWTDSHYRIN